MSRPWTLGRLSPVQSEMMQRAVMLGAAVSSGGGWHRTAGSLVSRGFAKFATTPNGTISIQLTDRGREFHRTARGLTLCDAGHEYMIGGTCGDCRMLERASAEVSLKLNRNEAEALRVFLGHFKKNTTTSLTRAFGTDVETLQEKLKEALLRDRL